MRHRINNNRIRERNKTDKWSQNGNEGEGEGRRFVVVERNGIRLIDWTELNAHGLRRDEPVGCRVRSDFDVNGDLALSLISDVASPFRSACEWIDWFARALVFFRTGMGSPCWWLMLRTCGIRMEWNGTRGRLEVDESWSRWTDCSFVIPY